MDGSNGSDGSGGGVILEPPSSKRIAPSLRWIMVLNNWSEDELEEIGSKVPSFCKVAIVGAEVGDSGTPHLQGYIEFKTKKRPKSVFTNDRIHWEKAKGDREANVAYCSKDNDLKIYHGLPEAVETISPNMLKSWQLDVLDEIKAKPNDRTIHWLWSEHGGVGKTTFLKYLVVHEDFTVLGGKASDCRNGIVEYAKAHAGCTPKRVGINIPRSFDPQYVSYEAYENIKDMLFYSGKYEGGMICGNCPHLYIFANFQPDQENLSEDRWRITKIW